MNSLFYFRLAMRIKSVSSWIERIGLYYFTKALRKYEKENPDA